MNLSDMKRILYLRTDICDEELIAGGSVAHTLGVIHGFQDVGYHVVCATSCMHRLLERENLEQIITLKNPKILKWLRWKINSFLSSFFFARNVIFELKNENVEFIYQRYSLLNFSGVLLAWWYQKKLVLEYNGSEYWVAMHWSAKKRWMKLEWLMSKSEQIIVRNADSIVVVSQVLYQELVAKGVKPHNILINPNGVNPQQFYPYAAGEGVCK